MQIGYKSAHMGSRELEQSSFTGFHTSSALCKFDYYILLLINYTQWWKEYWKFVLKYKYCYIAEILLNYK